MAVAQDYVWKFKDWLLIVSSDNLYDWVLPGMRFNFNVAWRQKCINFLLEFGYNFAFATVNWESGLFTKLYVWGEGNTDNIMVFAVDSEKEGGILTGKLRRWISDMFDFIDDIEVVVSKGIQSKDAFEVPHWK